MENTDTNLDAAQTTAATSENDTTMAILSYITIIGLVVAFVMNNDKKQEFATPESILIDDREQNIQQWRQAGGIAIHHTSANDTIEQLKQLNL